MQTAMRCLNVVILSVLVWPLDIRLGVGDQNMGADVASIIAKAKKLLQDKRPSEALEVLNEGVKIAPRNSEIYLLRGDAYAMNIKSMTDRNYDKALAEYEESIRLQENAAAYLRRAQVMFKWRSFNQLPILTELQHCLRVDPKNADALALRGAVLFRLGERIAAKLDFEQALAIDPKHGIALNNLGVICDTEGNIMLAITYYTAAIQAPTDDDLNAARSYQNRGEAFMEFGWWQNALQDLNESIRRSPSAFAYQSRAKVKVQLGDLEGAVEDLSSAIEIADMWTALSQFKATFLEERASVYQKLGRHDLAAKDELEASSLRQQGERCEP